MQWSPYALVALSLCWGIGGGANQLACPPGVQRIISYDLLLLHTDNVSASNEDAAFNPDEYLFHRSNVPLRLWCTLPFAGLVHHVNATFTEPVVITELISSGFSNGYVNNFTVEYSMGGMEKLTLYRDDDIEKNFIVPQIDTVFVLEVPFAAAQLRFTINDGVITPTSRLCWHLTLIGCTLSKAVMLKPELEILELCAIPILATPILATPILATPILPTPVTVVVKDYQMLVIALPVAVVTILLVVSVVSIGVFLCLRSRRKRWRTAAEISRRFVSVSDTDTVKVLDNSTLYKSSGPFRLPTSETMTSTSSALEIDNTLCSNQSNALPPADTAEYEPVNLATGDNADSSMVDNPNYSIPFQYTPQQSGIHMVYNQSYSVSVTDASTSHAEHGSNPPTRSANTYETPQ